MSYVVLETLAKFGLQAVNIEFTTQNYELLSMHICTILPLCFSKSRAMNYTNNNRKHL